MALAVAGLLASAMNASFREAAHVNSLYVEFDSFATRDLGVATSRSKSRCPVRKLGPQQAGHGRFRRQSVTSDGLCF